MRRVLLLVAALLLPLCARAYDCFPSGLLPQLGDGTAWRTTNTPAGFTKAWWCHLPVRQGDLPNKWYWKPQIFSVHNADLDLVKFAAAAGRVATAADPKAQADAEVQAARVAIPPGSMKEYEYRQLWYTACLDLRVNWPPGVQFDPKPADFTGPWVTEPAWCGTAPVPPSGQPTETWMTPPTGTLRLYTFAAGKLTSIVSGRTAATNALCNCAVTKIAVGSSTYCPVAAAVQTEVTFCKKVP